MTRFISADQTDEEGEPSALDKHISWSGVEGTMEGGWLRSRVTFTASIQRLPFREAR